MPRVRRYFNVKSEPSTDDKCQIDIVYHQSLLDPNDAEIRQPLCHFLASEKIVDVMQLMWLKYALIFPKSYQYGQKNKRPNNGWDD